MIDPKKNKKIIEHDGDMIFTHFGISGPAALRCSQFVVKALRKYNQREVLMTIDLFPDKSQSIIHEEIKKRAELEPKRAIKNVLKGYLPERLIPLLLKKAEINDETTFDHLPKDPLEKLAELVKEISDPGPRDINY